MVFSVKEMTFMITNWKLPEKTLHLLIDTTKRWMTTTAIMVEARVVYD